MNQKKRLAQAKTEKEYLAPWDNAVDQFRNTLKKKGKLKN